MEQIANIPVPQHLTDKVHPSRQVIEKWSRSLTCISHTR